MKKFKKMLSLTLAFVLCLSLSIPAFASTSGNICILRDDESVRIAQSEVDGIRYTSTHDKLNNTVSFQTQSIATGEILSIAVTDMNSHVVTTEMETVVIAENSISPFAIAPGSKTTEVGFTYNYTSTSCRISRPQKIENGTASGGTFSLTTVDRDSNHDALLAYRSAVNAIAADEGNIKAYTGAQKFAEGVTAVLAGPALVSPTAFGVALGTYFAALGFAAAVQTYSNQLGADMDDALSQYFDIHYDYVNYL